jgi:hypothetical protein
MAELRKVALTGLVTSTIGRQQGKDHTSMTEVSPDIWIWVSEFGQGAELSPDLSGLYKIH